MHPWTLAAIHTGLIPSFDLVADFGKSGVYLVKADEQFSENYKIRTINIPMMPPRGDFTAADCALHIKQWDFKAIDDLANHFNPLETICIMTFRDLTSFYRPPPVDIGHLMDHHRETLMQTHTAESSLSKILFFYAFADKKLQDRFGKKFPLTPDKMLKNLDTIVDSPELSGLDSRAKALGLKAHILAIRHSRKEKTEHAHTATFMAAHLLGSELFRTPITVQELCSQRKFGTAALCLKTYVRCLRAYGEEQLAEFHTGMIFRCQQLDQKLRTRNLMTVDEVAAEIEQPPPPPPQTISLKKKKKKSSLSLEQTTSTGSGSSEIPVLPDARLLPTNASELITKVKFVAKELTADMGEDEKALYLFGLRGVFSTLRHIYSCRTIYQGRKKQRASSAMAREYYGAKEIDSSFLTSQV